MEERFISNGSWWLLVLLCAGCSSDGNSPKAASRSAGIDGGAASGPSEEGGFPNAVECNPADKLPDATAVANAGMGAKPTGQFTVVVESDPGIADHTVYRPDPIGTMKHPIVAWGNGGCSKDSTGFAEFLSELTSHGFLIIADGTPGGTTGVTLPRSRSRGCNGTSWTTKARRARECSSVIRAVSAARCGPSNGR
jgi:hypothetical protein